MQVDSKVGSQDAPLPAANARIAVVGLGYVGLPLAVAFAAAGREVTGLDLDAR